MTSAKSGGFEVLEGFPPDVVAVSAHGKIDRTDYEEVFIPLIEKTSKAEGKARILYVIAADFEGFTAGAAWDDATFGLMHQHEFGRIAIIADVEWIRLGIRMFMPLIRCPVRLFHLDETEIAHAWITNDQPEQPHEPGVAVDRKLPTLEDKM